MADPAPRSPIDFAPLLHAIAWMRAPAPDLEVREGTRIARCENWNDDEDAFAILLGLRLLEVLPDESDRELIVHRFTLAQPTLREHLEAAPPPPDLDQTLVVGCFLRMAAGFGVRREGWSAIDALPVGREPSLFPLHFRAAVAALAAAGYCTLKGRLLTWSDAASPILHEQGLWSKGRVAADVEREKHLAIWDAMPPDLMARCVPDGTVNPLILGDVMRHCWNPDTGWHAPVSDPRYNQPGRAMMASVAIAAAVNADPARLAAARAASSDPPIGRLRLVRDLLLCTAFAMLLIYAGFRAVESLLGEPDPVWRTTSKAAIGIYALLLFGSAGALAVACGKILAMLRSGSHPAA